eukprot:992412_1
MSVTMIAVDEDDKGALEELDEKLETGECHVAAAPDHDAVKFENEFKIVNEMCDEAVDTGRSVAATGDVKMVFVASDQLCQDVVSTQVITAPDKPSHDVASIEVVTTTDKPCHEAVPTEVDTIEMEPITAPDKPSHDVASIEVVTTTDKPCHEAVPTEVDTIEMEPPCTDMCLTGHPVTDVRCGTLVTDELAHSPLAGPPAQAVAQSNQLKANPTDQLCDDNDCLQPGKRKLSPGLSTDGEPKRKKRKLFGKLKKLYRKTNE